MTSRELVRRTIRFENTERLPYDLPPEFGTDFTGIAMTPSPDARPRKGVDEWGAVWKNIGEMTLGEVQEPPLKDWANFDALQIPDIRDPRRWTQLDGARERAGDKFLLAYGISIYERVHFIRGLSNTWMDIYMAPENLKKLINVLVEMNLYAIERFAECDADAYFFCDDWGLQNKLMIDPEAWRAIWKPAYARIYEAAHANGMCTFLHSCGYIVDILDDLIEIGLDVIHMDQQENMGLDLLSERFGGRITFFSPVDIQQTMARGNADEIRAYCRKMTKTLGRPNGGFIPRWYTDPVGAGHTSEAVAVMSEEFVRLANG